VSVCGSRLFSFLCSLCVSSECIHSRAVNHSSNPDKRKDRNQHDPFSQIIFM
jgi:hypothetical protein